MYELIKRCIDIIISTTALLLLLPFFLIIAFILKFTAEGEVFYFQDRVGLNNKKFKIIKFATMLKNSLNMGTGSITLTNDFRVTRFGKYLRMTKINELPQLINIFLGDITLVGPRPILEQDWKLYPDSIQYSIYNIKPGLTGIGSIIFRDEESIISSIKDEDPHAYYERIIAPYKGKLEIWYQNNRGLNVDIQLIFLTAWVILFPKSNIYKKWFKNLPKRNF